jgi:protein involved in temperature-dependent protein secretion
MIVLLSSLIGFLSSGIPAILKLMQDKSDKAHELAIIQLQMQAQKDIAGQQLQAIQSQAESQEMIAIHNNDRPTYTWIDTLNASVRPVIAYCFFGSYVATRIFLFQYLEQSGAAFNMLVETLWDDQDMTILAGILSFYYGSRVFERK